MTKDDIVLDANFEPSKDIDGKAELGLDDFQGKFIKNPIVGKNVEFTIDKIYKKTKDLEGIDPLTKQKFKTSLSGVDYAIEVLTDDGSIFNVRNWATYGQIKQLAKKMNTIKGLKLKISHMADGMARENKVEGVELYRVEVFKDGKWQYLSKDGKWILGEN